MSDCLSVRAGADHHAFEAAAKTEYQLRASILAQGIHAKCYAVGGMVGAILRSFRNNRGMANGFSQAITEAVVRPSPAQSPISGDWILSHGHVESVEETATASARSCAGIRITPFSDGRRGRARLLLQLSCRR